MRRSRGERSHDAARASIAQLNADEDGDLDLFVVTSPGRVWLVTVAALVMAELGGWRRRLCLNFVVSERALAVQPEDLFSANQILHLRPVTGEPIYRRFLAANPFVWTHYPNFVPRPIDGWQSVDGRAARVRQPLEWLLAVTGAVAERACRVTYRVTIALPRAPRGRLGLPRPGPARARAVEAAHEQPPCRSAGPL